MNIHVAFTDISKIIDRTNLKGMDNLKRQAFLIPILTELQENSFKAGKKEARIETIKHIKNQL